MRLELVPCSLRMHAIDSRFRPDFGPCNSRRRTHPQAAWPPGSKRRRAFILDRLPQAPEEESLGCRTGRHRLGAGSARHRRPVQLSRRGDCRNDVGKLGINPGSPGQQNFLPPVQPMRTLTGGCLPAGCGLYTALEYLMICLHNPSLFLSNFKLDGRLQ